jgi:hypothetical protein
MGRVKWSEWTVVGAVALAVIVGWSALRSRHETVVPDLVSELPNVVFVLPDLSAYSVRNITITGETKRSIYFEEGSRLAWRLTVPDNAWLSTSFGMTEDAWSIAGGDGVVFRVTVFDDELLTVWLNPLDRPEDRRWEHAMVDLSEYAGQTVDLYLKTNAAPPGSSNQIGDHSAWGEPRVVVR